MAESDRALQSALESGIRGSLACLFSWALHVNLFDLWHFSGGDVALGLQAAIPLVVLDAALLLPDGARLAGAASRDTGAGARFSRLAGSALSLVQAERARYSLVGAATLERRAALAAAAQLSDELLSKGVLFGFATVWLTSRLEEAGLADATLPGAEEGLLLSQALKWVAAAAIVAASAVRYNHHATKEVAALQEQRRLAEEPPAPRADALLRYQPLEDQLRAAQQHQERAAARRLASASTRSEERLALAVHMLLGGRFVMGAAAGYAAFLTTGNLMASFTTGLALQLASGAMCSRAACRDSDAA